MVRLPTRNDVESGRLSNAHCAALLQFGASSLLPRQDWDDLETQNEVTENIVFRIDLEDTENKILIAADELFRAFNKSSNRKGLVLMQQNVRSDVPALRTMMANPTMKDCYRWETDWIDDSFDVESTMIARNRCVISRALVNGDVFKVIHTNPFWERFRQISVYKARKCMTETKQKHPFGILMVRRDDQGLLFAVNTSTPPPSMDKVVRIEGVHSAIDGAQLVTGVRPNGFITTVPPNLTTYGDLFQSTNARFP